MKKNILSLFILTPILLGCNSLPLKYIPYEYISSQNTFFNSEGDIYYRQDKINPLHIDKIDGVNLKYNKYDINNLSDVLLSFDNRYYSLKSNDYDNLNNYVEQPLLVAPIYFTDSSVATSSSLQEEKKILLENAFFGDSKQTKYESVSSFYNKSSYGHLRIKGEVLPWFSVSQSSEEAIKEGKNSPENYSDKIANMVGEYLYNNNRELFDLYSSNGNKCLDALYIVYDYPYEDNKKSDQSTLFWAYSYHCKKGNKVNNYAWSSFDFLGKNVLNNHEVEPNTFIHETGHLLGLSDYYNKSSSYQPLGFMDMMDYNLGDHTPLSKYLLSWTSPYVLSFNDKNEGDIVIRPFNETGDFILIPLSNYNNTPYDRYLLMTLFKPTGLNDLSDYPSYRYINSSGEEKIFTYPNKLGIALYEVNAKLGYYDYKNIRSNVPTCFVDEVPQSGTYAINFYYTNEMTSKNNKPFYHLLERSGSNTFMNGEGASNDTLFTYKDTFGYDTFLSLSKEFNVRFVIDKLTTQEARIHFSKCDN